MPLITVHKERCKGCELCNHACPQKIISMSETLNSRGYFYAVLNDPGKCIGCALCAITCPDYAIDLDVNSTRYVLFEY